VNVTLSPSANQQNVESVTSPEGMALQNDVETSRRETKKQFAIAEALREELTDTKHQLEKVVKKEKRRRDEKVKLERDLEDVYVLRAHSTQPCS